MATAEQSTFAQPRPAPIESVQPGGGFCMALELSWGKLRRTCLRLFFRGYVRQMAEKRNGNCPNCTHNIIDPRDLKFYRNVCGYSFNDADDPYFWRNRLPLARMGLAEVVLSSLLLGSLSLVFMWWMASVHWAFVILLTPVLVIWALILFFFRDPERAVPTDPEALVSPADGTITDIGEVAEHGFPGGKALRIGIFLSIFNVHVNRIPRKGKVVNVRYFAGKFLDARDPNCPTQNEQMWIDLEEIGSGRLLRVKQISGKIARRIVCWLKNDDQVKAGERFGMIKFGSRTEVYVPLNASNQVQVKVGDKVKGGSTILMRFKEFTLEI